MGGPDDWLPLSGIQHFCFCRRQWALIHLEQQWAENRRTVEGQLDHARCHDTNQTERLTTCIPRVMSRPPRRSVWFAS